MNFFRKIVYSLLTGLETGCYNEFGLEVSTRMLTVFIKGVMSMSITISGMASSGCSTLLSSLSSSSSSSSSSTSFLSDWYSITNGSYAKLMKAYYSSDASSSSDTTSSLVSSSNNNYVSLNDAKSLNDAIDTLSDDSLYEKVTTKDSDGNTTTDYDWDSLYSAAEDFVDSYNDLVSSGGNSSVSGVLVNVSSMTNYSSASKSVLASVGISINSDNTLSINETKFKTADISDIKSVFNSAGGYASMISSNASMVEYYAQSAISSGSYTSSGSYSSSYSSTYSSYA